MKVFADENIPFAKEAFGEWGQVVTGPGRTLTSDRLKDVDVLIVRSVTRVGPELLEGTSVRFVGTCTIGTDHIDVDYLRQRGIGFASAPGSNAESVAEYVVAASLTLAERRGMDLSGQRIGVVGVGNVGSRVARNAEALGMQVLLNDPPLQRA
ncbi:MAG: 4-phosphoerythronate dehydrogenase, partial [Planctomycetes bacterium]|nr:4-phosphoerythronate dehydrogenase [Planctomycetota bacterium]